MKINRFKISTDGIEALKQNWKPDLLSGFLIFLMAFPLCLGIAMATGFPPLSGILSAIIGGMLVTFLQGSYLTIKGPAVGLIAIIYSCVETMGKGDLWMGYKLTLAVIVATGIFQMLLGVFRAGIIADFFPSSAVYGMLAGIGIIIITEQFHVMMGASINTPNNLEAIASIPYSIIHMNPEIACIGILSLLLLFGIPLIENKYIQRIPTPALVLFITIPLGFYFDLEHVHKYQFSGYEYEIGPSYLLPSNILDGIHGPDFSVVFTKDFFYFVVMFTLVGSLESISGTKAIDILDPNKRKSNLNKDLLGVGIGNTIAGLVGSLPMTTVFSRSAANVSNGAKTKWSNFFHGLFLLLFVLLFPGLVHQIPLAALSAMLIHTALRLASPKVFIEIYRVGKEQLIIFLVTLFVTISSDVIVGIFMGICTKLFIHLYNGAPLRSLFKSRVTVNKSNENIYTLHVHDAAIFSNYLGFKKHLDEIPLGNKIVVDFSTAKLIDHTTMEHLHHYGEDYIRAGGEISLKGLENFKPLSMHPLSYRIYNENFSPADHIPRSKQLKNLARSIQFSYRENCPIIQSNFGKFSSENMVVKYEGNLMTTKIGEYNYSISDLSIVGGGSMKAQISQITALSISNLHLGIPIFKLSEEELIDKIMEKAFINDIDFDEYPRFSKIYKLKGLNEVEVRKFFTKDIIEFFEQNEVYQIESLGAELIIYKPKNILTPEEIIRLLEYGKNLIKTIQNRTA
jgi:MFS superfamily sulfate permease-like transporter